MSNYDKLSGYCISPVSILPCPKATCSELGESCRIRMAHYRHDRRSAVANGVPDAIAQPMRLGGHIFAGIWIAVSSLSGSTPMMVTGLISGIWLFVFTFVSPFYPMSALGPASLVVLVWLGILAWQNGSTRGRLATSG